MADFSLDFGSDLTASPTGDYAAASGDVLSRQRVIRLLASNARGVLGDGALGDADYVLHTTYGLSIGREVGSGASPTDAERQQAIAMQALSQEETVDQTQPYSASATIVTSGVRLDLSWTVADTGNVTTATLVNS